MYNIGNRISALESGINKRYITNELNQYITNAGFVPMYDLDGNGIKIKTSTGKWSVEYNAENRPIKFTQGDTVITMNYDYMGRRFEKIILNNQDVRSLQRFVYNGYLQIEELTANNETIKSYIWDPTETSATKPMVIKTTTDTLFYLHDANKNVVDILSATNSAFAHYEYSPFGAVTTSSGNLASQNNFTFSSEYIDDELGLVYYNYRHYNPLDGRWISRDPIEEDGGWNLYGMVKNNAINFVDYLGYDRYITKFEPLIGYIHVGVAVDTWECQNGEWVVTGTVTFDFSTDPYQFGIGIIHPGRITETQGRVFSGGRFDQINSNACADILMLNIIREQMKDPPCYSLLFNCVNWSIMAIQYGLTDTGDITAW